MGAAALIPAAASLIAGAASAAGSASSGASIAASNNRAADQQQQISQAALQNAINEQAYQKQLSSIGLQRSVAGVTTGTGSSVQFDPATNTWVTTLGPADKAIQNASNAASIARNTTDLRTQEGANQNAVMRSLMADRASGPALAAVRNFQPINQDQLTGLLQSRATLANNQAERPIIADTLRSFARTGTAAGPVLTQMMRDNADTLRKTVMDDQISSMTNGANINNANLGGLLSKYQGINSQGTPGLGFSPISSQNPSDALTNLIAQRSQGATNAPSQGAFANAISASGVTSAAKEAASTVPNSNLLSAQLSGFGQALPKIGSSISDLIKSFGSGDNNNADLQGQTMGNIGNNAFGALLSSVNDPSQYLP